MQKAAIAIVVVFMAMGCTIMEMQKENRAAEERIAAKEARLGELEAESARLEKQRALLAEKLEQTTLTSRQLNNELDQMIRENRRMAAMTEKQGRDIEGITQEIEALEAKKAALSRMEASEETDAAKKQKIQALQQEIRNYFLLGLKSKHRKNLR